MIEVPDIIVNSINILVFLLTVLIMYNGLNNPKIFTLISNNESVKNMANITILYSGADNLTNNQSLL